MWAGRWRFPGTLAFSPDGKHLAVGSWDNTVRIHVAKDWRQVKVLDTLHPEKGAERYRTNWRGHFISYYQSIPEFNTTIGGKRWSRMREAWNWLTSMVCRSLRLGVGCCDVEPGQVR